MSNIRFDFKGKRIVVTGASRGIGREIALAFGMSKGVMGLSARNLQELNSVRKRIEENGGACLVKKADFTLPHDIEECAEYFLRELDGIDILVNNAGIVYPEKIDSFTDEHWERTMLVNLSAPAMLIRRFALPMMRQMCGCIINISSVAGEIGIPERSAYTASKAGLNGLTRALAVELGPFNIRVNAVAPTVVLTEMGQKSWSDPEKRSMHLKKIPLGRFCTPQDVVNSVLFLASDEASMITGQVLSVDGGLSIQ